MKRLDYIAQKHRNRLIEILSQTPEKTVEDLIQLFSLADPNANKSATQWLVVTFLKKGFLYEDIQGGKTSKAYESLSLFSKYKAKLDKPYRDLNRYQTLAEVWLTIECFVEVQDNSKYEDKSKAYRETKFLIDRPDGFKIIIPLTEFSSCWWGRGTRWCTAGRNNNMFWAYSKQAPLYIMIFPNGEKIQLFVTNKALQINDSADANVKPSFIKKHYDDLKGIMRYALRVNPHALYWLQDVDLSYDEYVEAITKDGSILEWVPDRYRDYKMLKISIETCSPWMSHIDEYFQHEDIVEKVIQKYHMFITMVPDRFLTERLYLEALKGNPEVLRIVPASFLTYGFYLKAVSHHGGLLGYVPRNMLTLELVEKAVKVNPYVVNKMTFPLKLTRDIYLNAVKSNKKGLVPIRIPAEFLDKEFHLEALRKNPYYLRFIPKGLINEEMCQDIIAKHPKMLAYVPEVYRTTELILSTLKECPEYCSMLDYSDDIFRKALKINIQIFRFVFATPADDICENVLSQDGSLLECITEKRRTREWCLLALKTHDVVDLIPTDIWDQELYNWVATNSTYKVDYALMNKKGIVVLPTMPWKSDEIWHPVTSD